MSKTMYLISPAPDFPSYFNSEVFENASGKRMATVITLSLPTVAALVPEDFEVTLCDECVQEVDFDTAADFVGITGNISQWERMKQLARAFRDRGKTVVMGGPQATLRSELVRPHCDILVRGELEEIADRLFGDLRSGDWESEYVGPVADFGRSPVPRLDLYPNDRTLVGAVQTSRGCPFQCEFCEVAVYHGRKQRFKSIEGVIAELDQLHALAYSQVFITDDNLTACRKRAKGLLEAIAEWNRKNDRPTEFATQLSIEAADDDEMLELLADAGLTSVFIGIETPNMNSLREAKKFQNTRRSVNERIERFVEHGIVVMGGMVVGFDSDGPDIFRRQYEFAMSTPVPLFTAVALFAHSSTPLHARLEKEGRVVPGSEEMPYFPWNINIVPKGMTREELRDGLRWLINKLYDPRAFTKRVERLVRTLPRRGGSRGARAVSLGGTVRPVERECAALLLKLPRLGLAELRMALRLVALALRHPRLARVAMGQVLPYMQIRYLLDLGGFWEPELARLDDPPLTTSRAPRREGRVTGLRAGLRVLPGSP
jgi:radical SAM superfamily enzyme YgiQ (UPF0313 family)